jgi:hypothetical protein
MTRKREALKIFLQPAAVGVGRRVQVRGCCPVWPGPRVCLHSCSWSLSGARSSKLEQSEGEHGLVPTQGKLDQTAQEISAIFQLHGRFTGQ